MNVYSTYYGGGVAEILSSLTLLMNSAGIETGWRVIQGRPDFFTITKKMHNALQGGDINLSDLKCSILEEAVFENATRIHIDHDVAIGARSVKVQDERPRRRLPTGVAESARAGVLLSVNTDTHGPAGRISSYCHNDFVTRMLP